MKLTNRKAKHTTAVSATDTGVVSPLPSPPSSLDEVNSVGNVPQQELLEIEEQPLLVEASDRDDAANTHSDNDEEASLSDGSESKLKPHPAPKHAHASGATLKLTPAEQKLERWLQFAHSPLVQTHGVRLLLACLAVVFPVLFLFIADAHPFCDTPAKNDCQPRNFLFNLDIQILTGLFTIKAIICFPWRAAALWHLISNTKLCWNSSHNAYFPARSNALGHDIFGQPTDEPFFRIPHRSRWIIALLNVGDCVFQLLNQCTRIYFYSYALASTAEGKFWVDTFWPFSFVCGFAGGNLTDSWIKHLNKSSSSSSNNNSNNNVVEKPQQPNLVVECYRKHGPNPCKIAGAVYQHVREGHHSEEDRV